MLKIGIANCLWGAAVLTLMYYLHICVSLTDLVLINKKIYHMSISLTINAPKQVLGISVLKIQRGVIACSPSAWKIPMQLLKTAMQIMWQPLIKVECLIKTISHMNWKAIMYTGSHIIGPGDEIDNPFLTCFLWISLYWKPMFHNVTSVEGPTQAKGHHNIVWSCQGSSAPSILRGSS